MPEVPQKETLLLAESKGIMDTLFGPGDTLPPNIKIDEPQGNRIVYNEKIYVSGQVTDDNNIAELLVNRVPVIINPGRIVFFSHLADLREGKNSLSIEAVDEAGNRARKNFIVIREVLQTSQLPKEITSNHMRVAVFPFEQKGVVPRTSGLFQEILTSALLNRNRFRLMERDRMDTVLQEQKLSSTQLIDRKTAVNLGKLMAVQAIVTGSIIETQAGIEVVGRMIDTETAEILATERAFCNTRGLGALNFLAEALAVRFHSDFPMHSGIVIRRKGNHIFTDLGEDKIVLQRRLIVYREIAGLKNVILGYARVTQVLPEMSKAELTGEDIQKIKELDKVIVQ